jgi:hypothetical protein
MDLTGKYFALSVQVYKTFKDFSTYYCNMALVHRTWFQLSLTQIKDMYTKSRQDPPARNSITNNVNQCLHVSIPIQSLYPFKKLPIDQERQDWEHTIILCNMRTITPAQYSYFLLNLCNIIITTFKINLHVSRLTP